MRREEGGVKREKREERREKGEGRREEGEERREKRGGCNYRTIIREYKRNKVYCNRRNLNKTQAEQHMQRA